MKQVSVRRMIAQVIRIGINAGQPFTAYTVHGIMRQLMPDVRFTRQEIKTAIDENLGRQEFAGKVKVEYLSYGRHDNVKTYVPVGSMALRNLPNSQRANLLDTTMKGLRIRTRTYRAKQLA